jgi:hypothetical protein
MILGAPLRQTVAILHPTPTEEEIAEGGARGAAARVARGVDQQLAGELRRPLRRRAGQVCRVCQVRLGPTATGTPTRPGQGTGRTQDRQGGRAQIARSTETSAFEPIDACDAYDEWRSGLRDDPLSNGFSGESRSTNVISNVLEDV